MSATHLPMDTRFHCVYLLTSLDPQCQGDYYIGYTVNPLRRLRQHNGELVNGARRTSRRGRPWTIVCCVSGFTEDRAALKFEWCWQNPTVSARLKHTVGVLKGLRRLPYAVGTLHLLVRATLFNQLDLTLHIFEPELLHEAQTRAEVFLVMRSGPKSSHTTTSPQRSCGEASQADRLAHPATKCDGGTCASTVDGTQARSAFTAPNITASPTASLLPPLEPSALFHVEELTRQRFEDVYLSHDRCLLLPSDGLAGGGGGSFAAERDGEDSCLSASCPYDVSVLSQAARAEWSNASCDDVGDDDYVAEGKGSFSHDETGEAARCVGLVGSHTPSRTPSPGCADTRESSLNMVLGYRSEEEERAEKNIHDDQHSSTSASRSNSAPSRAPLASPTRAPRAGSAATPSAVSSSASRAPSSPALLATAAEGDATSRQRIPLRFAHFRDTDFANAHADEQYRLHHGLLPCSLCALPLRPPCVVHCSRAPFCELRCHLSCLAMWMLYEEERSNRPKGIAAAEYTARGGDDAPHHHQDTSMCLRQLIPSQPCPCPLCGVPLQWGVLIKELKRRTVVEERLQAAQRRARIEQRWQARLAQINGHRAIGDRRGTRRKRQRVSCRASATLPTPLSAAKCVTDVSTDTAVSPRSDPQTASATRTLAAPRPVPTSINEGEVSLLSSIAAAAPLTDASPLNWTAFCEDDWLL